MATAFVGAGDALDGNAALPREAAPPPSLLGTVGRMLLDLVAVVAVVVTTGVRSARARPGLSVDSVGFGLAVAAGAVLWGTGAALAVAAASVLILNAHYGKRRT